MGLADVCHDQVLAIVEAREARDHDRVIKGVQELIEGVDWYTQPDCAIRYPTHAGSESDALRRAAQRVIDHPDDEDDLLWLLALAECVRRAEDCAFAEDNEIDYWCALYRRGREDGFAYRCPECGAEDGRRRIRLRRREVRKVVITPKG